MVTTDALPCPPQAAAVPPGLMLGSVVVPTNGFEIDRAIGNFAIWKDPGYLPTLDPDPALRPALVFIFNNGLTEDHRNRITTAFMAADMGRFFAQVACVDLDLQGEDDVYQRHYSKPAGRGGFKAGPNNQFFRAMEAVSDLGQYTFLMETDCAPTRPDWLGRLISILGRCEPFWVMGSAYRGVGLLEPQFARHINGNAVYAAGDPGFWQFLTRFWQPQLAEAVRTDPRLAYDIVLEKIFSHVGKQHTEAWELWKEAAHKFCFTDYIQNLSGDPDLKRSPEDLLYSASGPTDRTYIIHSKVYQSYVQEVVLAALGKAAQALAFQRHNPPILATELAQILVSAAQPPRAKPSPVTGTPVTMPITIPRPALQLFADGKPLAAQALGPEAAHAHLATAGVTGLMLYGNPRRVIAARIAKGADPLVALQDWQAETAAHLALYRQHRARLVLVEAEAAAAAPAAVLAAVQALAARADASASQVLAVPSAFLPTPDSGPPDPVLLVLAGQILREDLPAARLLAECQASALALPGATPDQPVSADTMAAVAAYRAQLAAATRSGDLARDLAAAQQKLAQQAAALTAEQAASRDRVALQAAAVKSLETRLADATGKAAAAHLLQPQLAQLRLTAEAYHAEVAAHREMFAGMERDLQDLRSRLTAQAQARDAAVEALGLRNGLLDEANRRRVALEIAFAEQQTQREADTETIAALTRERDAAQAELDEVFRSHSWLVTAPMRSLRRGIAPKS